MAVVSYVLEEILFAFTALSSVHTARGSELFHAVAGIAVLGALAGVTAVTGLAGLVALAAVALTAVTGGSCYGGNFTGVRALARGVAAGGGLIHQLKLRVTMGGGGGLSGLLLGQLVRLTSVDLRAAVVLCTQGLDDTCKHSNPTLMRRISRYCH